MPSVPFEGSRLPQTKPPANIGRDPFLYSDDVEMQEDVGTGWGRGSGPKGGKSAKSS